MKELVGADVTVFPIVNKIPRRLREPAYAAAAFLSLSGIAATCGGDKNKVEPTSTSVGVASGQETERFNPSAFLRMPMPRDPDAKAVQGWKYSTLIRGTLSHNATDLIIGTDENNSDTWRPFPILAAADGVACVGFYDTSTHGQGNYIQELHPNGYMTRYLHSETGSLSDRSYPDCKTSKNTWLKIRQGDKLSESGDAGTEKGWTHLHFEVYDPQGNLIDPYDLYTTRTEYPDPNFINGKYCGPKTLWVNCPIDPNRKAELVPTVAPVATLAPVETMEAPSTVVINKNIITPAPEPTVALVVKLEDLDPYNPAERAKWAELAQKKILDTTWRFVNDLISGTGADLEDAYNLQIPENLESARLKDNGLYGHKASMEILEGCSLEMAPSLTRDVNVSFPIGTGVPRSLDEVSYLNYQQGYKRERIKVFISLTHNRADAHGTRLGFKRFDVGDPYTQPYITFEVVGRGVYIAEPRFCTYENSTLRR